MSDGSIVALRDLSKPDSPDRSAQLLSSGPVWVEFELTDAAAPLPAGTPVGFETSQSVYLGHVEDGENSGHRHLRVRVDHLLALDDVSTIQKRWSQEQPD